MLLVFLVLCASVCGDVARGQLVYALRRPPVRRAASAIEALERLRLAPPPIASYFPQVDSEAAGYPVEGDLYALPPQWTDEFVQQPIQEEPEYGFYEYEPYTAPLYRPQPPAYAEEVYPQEPPLSLQDPESAEYSDLMESYLMGAPQQTFENVQRRSEEPPRPSSAPATHSNSTTAPPTAPTTTQVQMTAVPASPEKKSKQSAVLPDPEPAPVSAPGSGQKEEPLFRPLQSSQRTTWSEGPPLARAKNAAAAPRKTPIPLLKQMIQKGRPQEEDPLMRELSSLKKSL